MRSASCHITDIGIVIISILKVSCSYSELFLSVLYYSLEHDVVPRMSLIFNDYGDRIFAALRLFNVRRLGGSTNDIVLNL